MPKQPRYRLPFVRCQEPTDGASFLNLDWTTTEYRPAGTLKI